jgi:hypothetical protein
LDPQQKKNQKKSKKNAGPLAGDEFYIYNCPMFNQRPDAGPQLIYTMLVYQSFGQFTHEAYKVYTAAEHLATYREEYPTRRRQLNAVKKDIEQMQHAVDFIAEQLAPVTAIWARFMGNKYTALDLYDMQKDLKNLEAACEEIENTPCPAKAAKEAEQAAQEPQKVTIELPAGVTLYDLSRIFDLASDNAHARRMKAHEDYRKEINEEQHTSEEITHLFNETENKCNYLSNLWNAANDLSDAVRDKSWAEDPTTRDQYFTKDNYLRD